MKSLDIGCGAGPKGPEGWDHWGVDIVKLNNNPQILKCDLTWESLPFEDNYFDRVEGWDVIEHIPDLVYKPFLTKTYNIDRVLIDVEIGHMEHRYPLIELFNEIWRVMKDQSTLFIQVPKFPHWGAMADPTHVSYWTPDRLNYFSGDYFGHRFYGHKSRFQKLSCVDTNNGIHMNFIFRAIKNVPEDYPYQLEY